MTPGFGAEGDREAWGECGWATGRGCYSGGRERSGGVENSVCFVATRGDDGEWAVCSGKFPKHACAASPDAGWGSGGNDGGRRRIGRETSGGVIRRRGGRQ